MTLATELACLIYLYENLAIRVFKKMNPAITLKPSAEKAGAGFILR